MNEEEKPMAFLANFRCGTGAPGAQTLVLNLLVSTPLGKPPQAPTVGGIGTITQATNPPLDLRTNITGVVHAMNGQLAVAMIGTDVTGAQNFQGVLVLPKGWGQPGSATYWYVREGQQISVGPVDAEPIAAEQAA
jgi:hypothetical protein